MSQPEVTAFPVRFLLVWKDDIVSVRELYRDRRYRRCIVLCSQLLEREDHPLLKTFLSFYQAVCFESLGHISHDRSNNKIPLLEQARDAFISASDLLPLPFRTTADGNYDEPQPSPACPTLDLLELYENSPPAPSSVPEQTRGRQPERCVSTSRASTSSRLQGPLPACHIYVDLHSSESPSMDLEDDSYLVGTPQEKALAKARLSRSLSSQHALTGELVPSPLFSKGPSSRKGSQLQYDGINTLLPLFTLNKPLPPTPFSRPLPELPFNHNAQFTLKGKRFYIVPRRKTALATLISKFEGRSPFDADRGGGLGPVHIAQTPVTKRFKRISTTFIAKNDDKENADPLTVESPCEQDPPSTLKMSYKQSFVPITPCPKGNKPIKPTTDLTSTLTCTTDDREITTHILLSQPTSPTTHLTNYNATLSSLRTSLHKHISTVTTKIDIVRTTQQTHELEKRRQFASMHSRSHKYQPPSSTTSDENYPFQTPPPPPPAGKDIRLRSFWSLQIADAQSKSSAAEDEKARERKRRIEKLRAEGWRTVRKEAKGFKGVEYYEELRRNV
ncbi:hypothetical protein LTR05_002278 [Lithohypha guttulata]|uniref:Uncharacterized protein n=1 Tax=Lithohypha guttulata TaxID=1690604 RepID=A0AAN7T4C7_9EURO|nr:hypothetical protein LTR05_002278 [Lithohypha guttulata]